MLRDAMEINAVTQEQSVPSYGNACATFARMWLAALVRSYGRPSVVSAASRSGAVETIHRTLKAHRDKVVYTRSRQERLAAAQRQMEDEAATSVQAVFRGWRSKRKYHVTQALRKNGAAAVIQRCFRCARAREQLAELRVLAAWAKRRDTLREAAIAIQAQARRMITPEKSFCISSHSLAWLRSYSVWAGVSCAFNGSFVLAAASQQPAFKLSLVV